MSISEMNKGKNMKQSKYVVGQEVRLKSGGPQMTINEVSSDGARCYWFDVNTLNSAWFAIDAIVPAA
jgi:uncharacterized protein YodC (DUF2158 family)